MLQKQKSSWIALVITVAIAVALVAIILGSHNLLLAVMVAMICFGMWLVYNISNAILFHRRSLFAEDDAERRTAIRRMWSNIFFAVLPFSALAGLLYFLFLASLIYR